MNPTIPPNDGPTTPSDNGLKRKHSTSDSRVGEIVAPPAVSQPERPSAAAETQAAEGSQSGGIESNTEIPATEDPVLPAAPGLEGAGLFGIFEVDVS